MFTIRRVIAPITVCLALVAALLPTLIGNQVPIARAASMNLVQYVNPLIGSDNGGATFPGAQAPLGMIQWSPDTGTDPGGYRLWQGSINGFSLTHINGVGCENTQDIPITPTISTLGSPPGGSTYNSEYLHSNETVVPGYYSILMNNNIRTELTTTLRSGIGRFTYPTSTAASMIINAGGSVNGNWGTTVNIDSVNQVITGSSVSGGFCGNNHRYTVYFSAKFNRAFNSFGVWADGNKIAGGTSASSATNGAAAYATFDTTSNQVILMKVALSYVSVANATSNLNAEIPAWDFDGVKTATSNAWNDLLNRIQVSGGALADLKIFYTALYHVFQQPNIFDDVNGQYRGFDNQIHTVASGHHHYVTFSLWDTYRTQPQLTALIAPNETSDMAQSLLEHAQQCGGFELWGLNNADTNIMDGYPAAPFIANAYAFGARNFDITGVKNLLVNIATTNAENRCGLTGTAWWGINDWINTHYEPSDTGMWANASVTLEYSIDDFSIAQIARNVGDTTNYNFFLNRAQQWQNVFNPTSKYVQPRNRDGSWPGFTSSSEWGFAEGNSVQYSWMVPHNLAQLFTMMGGNASVAPRLDSFFSHIYTHGWNTTVPNYWAGNETSLQAPWQYNWIQQPWKTQQVVRNIATLSYTSAPDGLAGNDDSGALSAWYIYSALGLYPEIPGIGGFTISGPLFPSATINLPSGKVIQINATGAAPNAPYIQSMKINNAPSTSLWVPINTLTSGTGITTLDFTMGTTANTAWGINLSDAPPSGDIPQNFPTPTPCPNCPTSTPPPTPTRTPTALVGSGNLALNKVATADSSCAASEDAPHAVDGSVVNNSKWCSTGARWLQVDLGSNYQVSQFVIKHAGAGGESVTMNSKDFNIQTSTDGTNWTTVVTVAGNTASITTHNITVVTARYLRLNVTTPTQTSDNAARIYEFEAYSAGGPTPTNTAVVLTNTPTITNTLAPATNTPTVTRTSTVTNTPVGPTNAPSRTATPTVTNTPVGPTNTPTRTATPTITLTPTATGSVANTGYLNPSSAGADTGGDGNGYEGVSSNAFTDNATFATDTNSGTSTSASCTDAGKDRQRFYNYGVSIPGTIIKGIEVRLDAKVDNAAGAPAICVQFSWDGGTTWTTTKTSALLTTSEATYVLGNATDTWGRTWAVGDFSNTNFRVRIIDVSNDSNRDFSLDWIAVKVYYQ